MDPNYPSHGYDHHSTDDYDQDQNYEDFNNTLLMHPETIMDDPQWYADFDYDANPDAYAAWDPAQAQQQATETESHAQQGESSTKKASSKGKGKAASSSSKGSSSQQVEIRFENEMPKAADWDAYKATIKDLYMTQNLSLKDVAEIMKETYQFSATERKYKHQFKKWDWHKYNKESKGKSRK